MIATTNAGKWREIRRILRPATSSAIPELISLADLPNIPEPEETGRTFADNALLKARYYARQTGMATVAEDSGLAIDALGGRPGVESARYPGATYPDKFANLYRELAARSKPWTARFVCSVAAVSQAPGTGHWALERPDTGRPPELTRVVFACEGAVFGEIVPEPRGMHGFGYDPIFLYPAYGRTFGEVSEEEKIAVSHRGQAFRRLREWLEAGG